MGLNVCVSTMFGYTRQELIDRKIDMLMPKIISDRHDEILENFITTMQSNSLNKERVLYGKNKNGYLIPITIFLRYIPSVIYGA